MDDLLKLAERCEKAPAEQQSSYIKDAGAAVYDYGSSAEEMRRFFQLLRAGAFLDAAMTLVPEGWLCTIKELWDGAGKAGRATLTEYSDGFWKGDASGVAATPALALCAAALRARSSVTEKEG